MSLLKVIMGRRTETENLLLELEGDFEKGVKLAELKSRYDRHKVDRIASMFYWNFYLDLDQGTFYLTDKGRKAINKLKGYNLST